MKLRLLTNFTATALAVLAFSACGEKGPEYDDPNVKVNPSELNFGAEGGTQNVSLTATVKWTAASSASWIEVVPVSGDPANETQTVKVTVSANDDVEREGSITFKSTDGTLSANVTVKQKEYVPAITESTAKTVSDSKNAYKYQRYRLTGTVKSLKSDGSFTLVDNSGSITVAGLSASEQAYGTEGGALDNVKERCTVTVVGYRVEVDGKVQLKYAFLENVTAYSEPDPNTAETKAFPYTADYKVAENGAIVNNQVFPYAFDALWTWSTSTGWLASGYKNQNYTTEATLYTEKVNLANAEKPILVFDHIVNHFESIDAAKEQTTLYIRKEGGEWTPIALSFSYPDEQGSEVMTSEEIKLYEYVGATVQFAFKYVSDENKSAGTWQILKVEVKKNEEPVQPDNSSGTDDYDKPGWDWNK